MNSVDIRSQDDEAVANKVTSCFQTCALGEGAAAYGSEPDRKGQTKWRPLANGELAVTKPELSEIACPRVGGIRFK